MRKKILLLLIVQIIGSALLLSQEVPGKVEKKSPDSVFSVGLRASYNDANIKIGDDEIKNSLIYSYAALEVNVNVLDNLTLGIVAGLNNFYLKNPVDVYNLPISLRINRKKSNSMVFGVNARSEFFLPGDFTLLARGEFLYFKLFKKEFPINLPIISGNSTVKNSFSQVSFELLGQYEGFSTVTLFAGPQLNLINGKYKVYEIIENIEGEETLTYKQKNPIGLVGGVHFDLGVHFVVELRLSIVAKSSASVNVFFTF